MDVNVNNTPPIKTLAGLHSIPILGQAYAHVVFDNAKLFSAVDRTTVLKHYAAAYEHAVEILLATAERETIAAKPNRKTA